MKHAYQRASWRSAASNSDPFDIVLNLLVSSCVFQGQFQEEDLRKTSYF